MPRFEDAPQHGTPISEAFTSPDSGVWARPRADTGQHQDCPLGVRRRLCSWLSWGLALGFFVGIAAIVLGTLLELTAELVELGQHGQVSDSRSR